MGFWDELRGDARRGANRRFGDRYLDDPDAAAWTWLYWIAGILVLGGLAALVGLI